MKKLLLLMICALNFSCFATQPGRLVMVVGIDISGSFLQGKYFKDSLDFLAHYLYAHLKGYGGLAVPHSLFVGSIGGAKPDEAKTFYPMQIFQYKDLDGMKKEIHRIFAGKKQNANTDYNAFFKQVADLVKNRRLVLRPISIVMLSDGIPDTKTKKDTDVYRTIDFSPLENLARNVTIRLLYTNAVVGNNWRNKIPRQRVKVWTQDAEVMLNWKNDDVLLNETKFSEQKKFFSWIKDLVDFNPRSKRVR